LHNFCVAAPDQTIGGFRAHIFPSADIPLIQGYQVTLSTQDASVPLPPPGIFNWHYLQCVIRRFATTDYKSFPNAYYHVYPFKTDDDADGDFDDTSDLVEGGDYAEPPYPTYNFDRFLEAQGRAMQMQIRAQEVAQWSS